MPAFAALSALLALQAAHAAAPAPVELSAPAELLPNYHGCVSELAKTFAYCNVSLGYPERVDSLLSLLSLEEKVGLIAPDPSLGSTCFAHIHGIPRVGLPEYGWLVEMNTGVASECLGPEQCATTFVGPTGLGAAFNREMWAAKGDVLSTEMRAFSNAQWYRGTGAGYPGHPANKPAHIGTSAFGPNLNALRDPRYGRNSELPGEDPFMTGSYGVAFVSALQTPDANGHPRVNAYLKHFDAYATETNRMHSDNNVTAFDFWDSYLPQYQMVFTQAKAAGAMCSYQAENGMPSCANSWLLNDVLRKKWNRPDAYVTTDCGAVTNTMGPPLNLKTKEEACAATINAGTDLEMGTTAWNSSMVSAVSKGLVTEATVTTAASRGLLQRFVQGDFDPVAAPAPPPPPPGACGTKMVPHMDTTGSYLPGTPHILTGAAATPAHCQKMCCGEPQCDTFTFDTGQTPSGADCWLKAGGTLTVGGCGVGSKYNCTSGQVRTGHHVGPSPVPGPPGTVEWTSIGKAVVNSTAHQTVAYDAALQSMVMLKNTGVLPLKQGAKVAVIGPFGICQQCYVGPYFGDDICYAPEESLKTRTYDCIPTIASQIAAVNAGGTTTVAEGVAISGSNSSGVAAALALVEAADVVVLAIGIDHSIEHEGKDAPDSALPGLQESFSLQVLAKKKPTVLLLMGNDCNGIDKLIAGSAAIVRGFYPATHGARALASLLFGKANRWGKLPVTMYPHGYLQQLPAMGAHTGTAYSFAQPPGRSYRYYTGTPLFKFGTGLSLTTFNISCGPAVLKAAETSLSAAVPAAAGPPPLPIYRKIIVSCVVSNTGKMVGDEVLLVFHSAGAAVRAAASKLHAVPAKQLVEFTRFSDVAPGKTSTVTFVLDPNVALALTNATGAKVVYPGQHTLSFSTGVPNVPDLVQTVTVDGDGELHQSSLYL